MRGRQPNPLGESLTPRQKRVLALAGGLLAGSFGSWRIARLRPADALTRVA